MISQVVNRVIGRAYTFYIVAAHESTGGVSRLLQFLVTLVIYFTCCLRAKQFVYAKGRFQLKVRPMVKRVAECIRNRLGPFLKLFPVTGLCSRAIFLIHTIGAHRTPLVMVSSQPKLRDALELVVVGNHFRYQMAMIVDNRHFCRMVMK